MEPGRGAGIFTGQSVLFFPARIALMRAMLSFLVRPATDGTVIGGSFGVVSAASVALVLDAVVTAGVITAGVDVAAKAVRVAVAVEISGGPPGGTTSSAVVAPASLLAAQPARDAVKASVSSTETDLYLTIEGCIYGNELGGRQTVGISAAIST